MCGRDAQPSLQARTGADCHELRGVPYGPHPRNGSLEPGKEGLGPAEGITKHPAQHPG